MYFDTMRNNSIVIIIGAGLVSFRGATNPAEVEYLDHGEHFRIQQGLRKYACDLKLDPNTAHVKLSLCEEKKRVTHTKDPESYPDHPERFENYEQVLCGESLTERCYWEAEWSGKGAGVAVACKGISRKGGNDCWFGYSDKSWSLYCTANGFTVWHNNTSKNISSPSPPSNRVGVYLDWPSGTLSFYSISGTNTLTHIDTLHTTFTEPLYAGFRVYDASVSLCQI